jgi:alpha-galactosidase
MIAETGSFKSIEQINFMEKEERRPVLIQAVKTFSTKFNGGVMNNKCASVFAVVLCAIMLSSTNVFALKNGLARTPPMGFNTWNYFGCKNSAGHGTVNEALMIGIADAFNSKGMTAVGYQFVNVDDGYGMANRSGSGGLVADPAYFPHGMKACADSIHKRGLKFGLYTDVGNVTCATCYGSCGFPGMLGHEQQDCDTFAAWGIDYVKIDFCCFNGTAVSTYSMIRDCMKNSLTRVPGSHKILFSICNWGNQSPWDWGDTVGNLWRTTGDINNSWGSMLGNSDNSQSHNNKARIGSWNDPDMLEVGYGDFATNYAQARAHMSLWCIEAAPLIAGNDVRNMNTTIQSILTNSDVIAVDQDTLSGDTTMGIIQGRRVVSGNSEVWVKLLRGRTGSEYAVLFFNRNNGGAVTIGITEAQIASVGGDITTSKTYTVRDLWAHTNLANWTANGTYTSPSIPVHDVFMIRLGSMVSVLPPIASVKVKNMRVQSEGERVVIHTARTGSQSVSLVNMKGAVVYTKHFTGPQDLSIPTTGMPRGLYFVNVQTAQERFAQKIILK